MYTIHGSYGNGGRVSYSFGELCFDIWNMWKKHVKYWERRRFDITTTQAQSSIWSNNSRYTAIYLCVNCRYNVHVFIECTQLEKTWHLRRLLSVWFGSDSVASIILGVDQNLNPPGLKIEPRRPGGWNFTPKHKVQICITPEHLLQNMLQKSIKNSICLWFWKSL